MKGSEFRELDKINKSIPKDLIKKVVKKDGTIDQKKTKEINEFVEYKIKRAIEEKRLNPKNLDPWTMRQMKDKMLRQK